MCVPLARILLTLDRKFAVGFTDVGFPERTQEGSYRVELSYQQKKKKLI